jgi:hypothetical protein
MTRSGLRLTRRTDMWRAWVGFNLSHGLGVVVFALFVFVPVAAGPCSTPRPSSASGRVRRQCDLRVAGAALLVPDAVLGCLLAAALFLASWITRTMGP